MFDDPPHIPPPAVVETVLRRDSIYQVSAQHWAHAEMVRWTSLYNFLMGATILSLAWATIFAAAPSASRRWVLGTLALAGALLSTLWVALGKRSTHFVTAYAALGRTLEMAKPDTSEPPFINCPAPFATAEALRPSICGMAHVAQSWRIMIGVPAVFAIIFVTLFIVSLLEPTTRTA